VYASFFGLNKNPFEITPDPRFFFGTPGHNEALASLCYGVDRRKGFIVITGEVGTGKTLLTRCLSRNLTLQQIPFAYIFNPLLSILEFLQYAVRDMGVSLSGKTKGDLLGDLNRFLIAQHRQNSTAVLIIDEAHLLSWELLEEIRLLTNLETAEQKLLQIILVGQPELDQKLESQSLRQLKQRISLRCRLLPLSEEQTRKYVELRLLMAGAQGGRRNLFAEASLKLIHQYSGGIPRIVNTICEAALVATFALRNTTVSPEIIEEIAADFRLSAKEKLNASPRDTRTDRDTASSTSSDRSHRAAVLTSATVA